MAFENGINKNPPFSDKMQSVLQEKQQLLADYWTLDRVIRWLEANDFKSAIDVFKVRNICGRTFLEVDMSYLMTLQNELALSYSEKRRLAHSIKALRGYSEDLYSNNYNQRNLHTSNSSTNLNTRYNNARYAPPSTGLSTDNVTPLIPERTSSNNEQVLDWVKSFNIPKRPIANSARLNSNPRLGYPVSSSNVTINNNVNNNTSNTHYPISPSSPRVGDDGQWKFVRRRPNNNGPIPSTTSNSAMNQHYTDYAVPAPLPPQQKQQFIHVTKDSDTFHNLQVTGMHDPRLIKNTILRKLGLEGKCEKYLFYHENGNNSDIALSDSELSQLCQNSDHSSPNRILVKPADHALAQYRAYSYDGTNCYDFAPQGNYARQPREETLDVSPSLWVVPPKQQQQPQQQMVDEHSLWAVPPRQQSDEKPSLWAVPPRQQSDEKPSLWAVPPRQQSDEKPSLWAVPPKPQQHQETSEEPSLWAVPPRSQSEEKLSLWAVPPKQQQQHPEAVEEHSLWAVPPRQPSDEKVSLWAVSPKQQQQEEAVEEHSLWAVPPKQPSDENPALWALPSNQPQQETVEKHPLWAVPPRQQSDEKLSLWAVPPKQQQQQQQQEAVEEHSLWAVPPQQTQEETLDISPSLWAVPPKQQQEETLDVSPSVWAVPPKKERDSQKIRGVQFMLNDDTAKSPSGRSVASAPGLEENIESISLSDPPAQLHDSHSAQNLHINTDVKHENEEETSSPLSSPLQTNDEENWAERPSVERLYKDIDKYLPGHDLDKEIIVENQNTAPAATLVTALPPGRRLGGHKKSIRNVAKEAHRNWKNAVNVIRANNLLRRRSTKMWHRAVEQVKPGMKVSTGSGDSTLPKSKKLHWIRGELIGKGSFGRVYHALNVEAGEWIAVKQVDLPTTKADYNNPQLREIKDALFREISLLEDLDNEYIVQYLGYDVDEEEGHINIFLEYVPGGSIASCLAKTGKFEIPLVHFFTRQILMGLAYLHNRNVLHRDIKAGNILLDHNGICKITDFGLSKLSGQDKAYDPHSNNSVMRGTVFWMAPEVVKGTNYNAKVDIWSLGCTVIEMLTGNHPWLDLNMLAALYSLGKYQAPPIPEDIPEDARDFLTKCFTINPEERPTAEQLLTHPFVQPDPAFEFRKYMKKAEIERRASRRLQATVAVN